MPTCFFVSDLHGHPDRYAALLRTIADELPAALFLGGDLLPTGHTALAPFDHAHRDFVSDYLAVEFERLRTTLGSSYPRVFLILGNDDSRSEEAAFLVAAGRGTWEYIHDRRVTFGPYDIYGYACVPPTPFTLKDWERYDVSRYVDPGCVSPEEGYRSIPVSQTEARYATIKEDLERLVGDRPVDQSVFLFHSPPYRTKLDRAALDGRRIDHVPVDVHVGSIAIQRFIQQRQPLLTLHGHIHESARLTGAWADRIGRTHCFSAAHDGPELALVRFDPADPAAATRTLM